MHSRVMVGLDRLDGRRNRCRKIRWPIASRACWIIAVTNKDAQTHSRADSHGLATTSQASFWDRYDLLDILRRVSF